MFFLFLVIKVIRAESETVEEELNISPELARELLLSALKLLEREKNSHISPKPVKVLRIVQQPQPCSSMVYSKNDQDEAKVEDSESSQDSSNSRRSFITTKTAIARDPYTGINRLVTVPVIYPSYHHVPIYG